MGKIYVRYATVRCNVKGSRVNVNRWRVLLKAEARVRSKNGQDVLYVIRSQRTAFSDNVTGKHLRAHTRWKNDEMNYWSSQSCARNYFNYMLVIIIAAIIIICLLYNRGKNILEMN